MKVYYLKPKSSFRTKLPSDTLWGMIIGALSYLYDENYIKDLISKFVNGKPPFMLSSCFPFKNEGSQIVHYLPMPLSGLNIDSSNIEYNKRKDLKKMNFVRLDLFNELINKTSDNSILQKLTLAQKPDFFKSETNVKIKINRLTTSTQDEEGKGQLYNSVENYFINGGYYFIIDGDSSIIEPALRLLSHNGFGAYTSKGKGHFQFNSGEIELQIPNNYNHWLTLSLYHPTDYELDEYKKQPDSLWYETKIKKGKIGNQFRVNKDFNKKPVLNFIEGSVFPNIDQTLYGTMTKTYEYDNFNIYNCGYAFKLPILI